MASSRKELLEAYTYIEFLYNIISFVCVEIILTIRTITVENLDFLVPVNSLSLFFILTTARIAPHLSNVSPFCSLC
jgi:hypothetical protein